MRCLDLVIDLVELDAHANLCFHKVCKLALQGRLREHFRAHMVQESGVEI